MGLLWMEKWMCPDDQRCSQSVANYFDSKRSAFSLALGLISVMSWGVAEVPQIVTNFKKKSSKGLSIWFLMTWILGDLLNLFGCLLEPGTSPGILFVPLVRRRRRFPVKKPYSSSEL